MSFALTDDQRAIQDTVAAFLADRADLDRLRAVVSSPEGWDAALWQTLSVEMGYAGLMVPEAFGGAGGGAVEMALVLEEAGRRLAVVPFFETAVLAVQTLLEAGSDIQKSRLLPEIAAGTRIATLAEAGPEDGLAPTARLERAADGWRLDGAAGFVPFGHVAGLVIVAARTGEGLSLVAVPTGRAGVTITREPPLDLTRPFARIDVSAVAVAADDILGVPGTAAPALERVLTIGAGLLAAEQTGGAAFCLESTVAYARDRVQFGRPIGSFQAVKHDLADMMVAVEACRSAALHAALAIDSGDAAAEACAIAKSWCSDAYRRAAGEAIQLHGGIGFTWEHHAHLYFKRAWSSARWLGDAATHRARIAHLIGLDAAPGVSS